MRFRLRPLSCWLMLAMFLLRQAEAEDRSLEFVKGLRERNYFDYAMLYLDQLNQRPTLSPELRQIILFEKAITLRENAKVNRNPEKQFEQLDQAMGYLEQFTRDFPDHPNAADANLDRAQILLQKAEVEITQAKSPSNKSARNDHLKRGREYVGKAREVLKRGFEQHEAAFKKLPAYIDEQKDPKKHAERASVERSLILESLNLAKCTYQEAQTYDSGSRDFKQLLRRAADEFEKVHQKYRSQLGGLHARAWQGKCFEELGERTKALGLYNELLEQPGQDPSMQSLKSQTLLFKLICLQGHNDEQTIVDLAEEWLKKNGSESKTQLGLGIQWEQARALEALGDQRNLSKQEQEKFWRQSRIIAQQVNRFPGEYKDSSLALMQRLQTKLGGKERKPEDFDSAYSLGRQSFDAAQETKHELEQGAKTKLSSDEMSALTQRWQNELAIAARNFELASTLVGRRDNPKDVATSRLLQAYSSFYLRRNFEAAILAQYVARTTNDEDVALDAAYMAMAAFVQAYNDNKTEPDKKSEEMRMIMKSANLIINRWPESEKANEARLVVGRVFSTSKKPVDAAEWFRQIPDGDPKYAEAQLAAGQAFWSAYGAAARQPADTRPGPEKLSEWKSSAEEYLRRGLAKLASSNSDSQSVPQELVSAKIYLAEILLSQGKEADAVKLLIDEPQSVVKAVAVPDETIRPEKGIQSRSVAKSVYTLLLRAYIGLGLDKLNEARVTMRQLEAIAAGDAGSDLTELYVGLGRVLKTELERFRNNGETARLKKLTAAFESFLNDMLKKQDGQTFGSLSWIGETYFALGEMAEDSKADQDYENATSAFQSILTRAKADPAFATAEQLGNVKVRLIHCFRLKRNFTEAEQLLNEMIGLRGNDLRTQTEGALVYQDWGLSSDRKQLLVAIAGKKEAGLWGWGGIARRIQQQKDFSSRPEFVDPFLDARYGVSFCRYQFAKQLPTQEKQKALDLCAMELVGSASIMKTLPDDKRASLNQLYRDVLREAGKPVSDLPRAEEFSGEQLATGKDPAASTEQPIPVNTALPTSDVRPASTSRASADQTTWIAFVTCLVGGLVMVVWVVLASRRPKPKAKTKRKVMTQVPQTEFTGIAVERTNEPTFSLALEPKVEPTSSEPEIVFQEYRPPKSASTTRRPKPQNETGKLPPIPPATKRPRPPEAN